MENHQLVFEEVTDPAQIERSQRQFERGQRNMRWLEVHWPDLLPAARGKFIAVAGEEAFIADSSEGAWEMAYRSHPEDNGAFVQHVPAFEGTLIPTAIVASPVPSTR